MVHLLIQSALAAAALGVSLNLRPAHLSIPTSLLTLAAISTPIGQVAGSGRTVAHPIIPAAEAARSVRVVLASPFAGR